MALISGCGAGIGEASARLFAEHGATLWLNDLRTAELNRVVDELVASGAVVAGVAGWVQPVTRSPATIRRPMMIRRVFFDFIFSIS